MARKLFSPRKHFLIQIYVQYIQNAYKFNPALIFRLSSDEETVRQAVIFNSSSGLAIPQSFYRRIHSKARLTHKKPCLSLIVSTKALIDFRELQRQKFFQNNN